MTPSPEQPEHEEARRLAGKLLTENERKLAKASWAYGVVADPNIPKWGNLVLEAYDAAAALVSKAEQERDSVTIELAASVEAQVAERERAEAAERELERLREALDAVGIDVDDVLREIERALSADTPARHQRKP